MTKNVVTIWCLRWQVRAYRTVGIHRNRPHRSMETHFIFRASSYEFCRIGIAPRSDSRYQSHYYNSPRLLVMMPAPPPPPALGPPGQVEGGEGTGGRHKKVAIRLATDAPTLGTRRLRCWILWSGSSRRFSTTRFRHARACEGRFARVLASIGCSGFDQAGRVSDTVRSVLQKLRTVQGATVPCLHA